MTQWTHPENHDLTISLPVSYRCSICRGQYYDQEPVDVFDLTCPECRRINRLKAIAERLITALERKSS